MDVPFLQAVTSGGLVCDGAMGSLLYERGIFVDRNFDSCSVSQPELVSSVHHDYLLSGAQLCETNTYGANRLRLARHGLADKVADFNRASVDVLQRSTEGAAYIAGSIGPTGLAPAALQESVQEVREAYEEQAQILSDAGCDVLCIETFHDPEELRIAIIAARHVSPLPIIALFAPDADGNLIAGASPHNLGQQMVGWGADVVGANCGSPAHVYALVCQMRDVGVPLCAMPNAGHPQTIEDRQIYLATPENFGVYARRFYKAGVSIVGGCCGTSPAHIRRVAAAARMCSARSAPACKVQVGAPPAQRTAARPLEERSALGALLGRHFVVSVEVNPQPGLDCGGPLAAARSLRRAGADVINIADGPRATARMSNVALALKMKHEVPGEILVHMCCRDHNLLGLQAAVLGMHTMGLHNVVVITGDPPKMGEFPDATAVYDLDSVGLIKLVAQFNQGIDPSGKSCDPTHFVIATGVEPAAQDFDREMVRLRLKVASGANLIMTQPVYDPAQLQRFLRASQDLDVPVLVGILPLASARNAEFLHQNIPGMQVPEAIRRRMRDAGRGDAARRVGMQIAIEALLAVRGKVAGAYIMPPLGRYDMAATILDALGKDRSVAKGVPGRRD